MPKIFGIIFYCKLQFANLVSDGKSFTGGTGICILGGSYVNWFLSGPLDRLANPSLKNVLKLRRQYIIVGHVQLKNYFDQIWGIFHYFGKTLNVFCQFSFVIFLIVLTFLFVLRFF